MVKVTSILTAGPNNHQTTSEEANYLATDFLDSGVLGALGSTAGLAPMTGGFAVGQQGTPDMTVAIQPGTVYILTTPTGQNAQVLRTRMTAAENVTIQANATGSTRYDWIYIRHKSTEANAPNTAGDNVAEFSTSRSTSASTDDGTPPTNAELLAVVTVANGATSITNANISDRRTRVTVTTGVGDPSTTGWNAFAVTPTVVSGYNKGQKEYDLTFADVDYSTLLTAGMRFRCRRGTIPPTQSADLELSSSQYANKTTPSGITFTDDFTVEASIRLESIGTEMYIMSRRSATQGWGLRVTATGALELFGLDTTADLITSQQILPTGRWVHVAATLDMSGAAGNIYIDGALVASTYTNAAATALVQAGDLRLGASHVPGSYFDGMISEVRVWTQVRSATQIRDNMHKQLVGNEANLAAYYKLDGNFNDSTANANNLTSSGGALATTVDNPMKSTEYGIITKVAYSAPNTTVTVFTGTDYSIPLLTLADPHYSLVDTPYGFPRNPEKWAVRAMFATDRSTSSTTFASLIDSLVAPAGDWVLKMKLKAVRYQSAAATDQHSQLTLSSSGTAETNPDLTVVAGRTGETAATGRIDYSAYSEDPVSLVAQTTFTLLGKVSSGSKVIGISC